jgi:hypothetical protein
MGHGVFADIADEWYPNAYITPTFDLYASQPGTKTL